MTNERLAELEAHRFRVSGEDLVFIINNAEPRYNSLERALAADLQDARTAIPELIAALRESQANIDLAHREAVAVGRINLKLEARVEALLAAGNHLADELENANELFAQELAKLNAGQLVRDALKEWSAVKGG